MLTLPNALDFPNAKDMPTAQDVIYMGMDEIRRYLRNGVDPASLIDNAIRIGNQLNFDNIDRTYITPGLALVDGLTSGDKYNLGKMALTLPNALGFPNMNDLPTVLDLFNFIFDETVKQIS